MFFLNSAWDDIYDVFGNGDEYDWVLEDEEQQMGGLKEGEKPNMHDVRFTLQLLCLYLFFLLKVMA